MKGIIFSAPMVRALGEGRKTVTRRLIKPQPYTDRMGNLMWKGRNLGHNAHCKPDFSALPLPYRPGERLYVKEAWQHADWTEDGEPFIRYRADGDVRLCDGGDDPEALMDRWAELSVPENAAIDGKAADRRWRSPAIMPEWASRYHIEVVSVEPQRIQEISEADARAEGVYDLPDEMKQDSARWSAAYGERVCGPRSYFRELINSLRPGTWERNEWYARIEFKLLEREVRSFH